MPGIDSRFSDEDHRRVAEAVREAESRTSAEIVPVVAASSGRYDRAEDVVGLWCAVLALVVAWLVYPLPRIDEGSWSGASPIWQLVVLVIAVVVGFVGGAMIGTWVDPLRRLFAPPEQMRDEVLARARSLFHDQRVHHTAGGSGVLLYVSLFEHRAAVVADQSVLQKLGQPAIDDVCREFTARLHEGSAVEAICATARSLGERLAPLLPRAEDDVNELEDALIVLA